MKALLWIVGGLLVLFVGSAFVAGILEGLGVTESSEEGEKASESQPRDGEDGKRADRDQKTDKRSRWPLTRVTKVIDGDTVHTDRIGRVRLIGVNTPEEGRCGSNAATRFTKQRIGSRQVGYELGAERKDRYGRTLAYLYRGERMHDLDLVREGYAKVLTIPPNDKYAPRFERAARQARRAKAGALAVCERRTRRAKARRRAMHQRRARQERRERQRRERERREREQIPDTPDAPDSPGGGGGGGGNVPGIPGI